MNKELYLVWNMTNYGDGYEMLGAYTTKEKATRAYNREMKKRYGTTDEDELWDIWNNGETGSNDSWRITTIELKG